MLNGKLSRAELLSDSALYQRTARGQRERRNADFNSPRLRILAMLGGHTDVRRLVELAAEDAPMLADAVEHLLQSGMIERVDADSASRS